ncbi:MAG: hypothetical protein AAB225_18370 [Acidobacteriota bacterium]
MYRILLVEDQELTRETLLRLLRKYFPDAEVKGVANEAAAGAILKEWEDDRIELDAAVLDLKLPRTEGGTAVVSDLCDLVARLQPRAVVGHITAYFRDKDVNDHLVDLHVKKAHKAGFTVDKTEQNWEDDLLRKLMNYRVERKLDEAFDTAPGFRRRSARGWAGRSSATYRIASLADDISRYWKHLEPHLQDRIRKNFDVQVEQDKVYVGLGGISGTDPA